MELNFNDIINLVLTNGTIIFFKYLRLLLEDEV